MVSIYRKWRERERERVEERRGGMKRRSGKEEDNPNERIQVPIIQLSLIPIIDDSLFS